MGSDEPRSHGKFFLLFWIALICSGIALIGGQLQGNWFATLLIGGVILSAISAIWVLRQIRMAADDRLNALKGLIFHDPRPVIIADEDGQVITRNAAALTQLGDVSTFSLRDILGRTVADPDGCLLKLQAGARAETAATETLGEDQSARKITVFRLPNGLYHWSVEAGTRGSSVGLDGPSLLPEFDIPLVSIAPDGEVLTYNDQMRGLFLDPVTALSDLFTHQIPQDGQIVDLGTAQGRRSFRAVHTGTSDDQTAVAFLPCDVQAAQGSQDCFTLLEDFPVALLSVKPGGCIQHANKLARRLLLMDELEDRHLPDVIGGLGRPVLDWLADAAEGRALHQPEVLRARGGDDETYLQVVLGRVIEDGEVSLIAMITDATELKNLELQFVQSQKMQAIGQLAGGVAHDFNNLLTAISGHCDLLMLRHDPGDPDYGDLEQINQNANRAASLVGQLLAFSRKQNLQLEVLDMRDTLSDLTHLLNRLVGANIDLNLTHDPQLMTVRADRRQLEQVIMNLVVNARDAMEGNGGEILIETRNAKLENDLHRDRAVVPRGDYVVVKVRDNGVGIPREKQVKIFEPFFTTKRTGEGTGLGLSTAYGIVKQSGGFIFVNSEIGVGTEFTIFFPTFERPAVTEDVASKAPVVPEMGAVDGIVLLVEDEAPVRAFASRALKLRGFQVLEAESGEEALELLDNEKIDVDIVVSDVVMPGLDGPTWVKKARETRPNMKVVFVSGYAEENFTQDQPAIPNSIFLPKPFSLNELTTTVRGQLADLAA